MYMGRRRAFVASVWMLRGRRGRWRGGEGWRGVRRGGDGRGGLLGGESRARICAFGDFDFDFRMTLAAIVVLSVISHSHLQLYVRVIVYVVCFLPPSCSSRCLVAQDSCVTSLLPLSVSSTSTNSRNISRKLLNSKVMCLKERTRHACCGQVQVTFFFCDYGPQISSVCALNDGDGDLPRPRTLYSIDAPWPEQCRRCLAFQREREEREREGRER